MGFHITPTKPPTHALSPVIPNNVWTVRLTAAAGTNLARPSSEYRSKPALHRPFLQTDSGLQPEGLHPARGVARSDFRPLPKISTAATRRCLGSVSVPVSRAMLSHPVTIAALVSHYLTNKLIVCGPIQGRNLTFDPKISSSITASFPTLSWTPGHVTTRYSPFRRCPCSMQAKNTSRTTCMPNPRRQRSF